MAGCPWTGGLIDPVPPGRTSPRGRSERTEFNGWSGSAARPTRRARPSRPDSLSLHPNLGPERAGDRAVHAVVGEFEGDHLAVAADQEISRDLGDAVRPGGVGGSLAVEEVRPGRVVRHEEE